MPITYGGDDYGWLATQGGVADLPVPKQVLDLEKTLMEASKAGQDTSAYWDQLRPYFESRYDPELFKQNQAQYAKQQGDALIAQAGGVKITPEQLQQMKNVNAQGGIYSVLDPSLNRAPDPNYAAKAAAYQSQYTNPTATNAIDFLASLKNFGGTPATPSNPNRTQTLFPGGLLFPDVEPLAPTTPQTRPSDLGPGQYYGVEGQSVAPGTFDPTSPNYNPNVVRWQPTPGETPTEIPLWSTAGAPTKQATPSAGNLPMMSYGNVSAASTAPAAKNIPTSIPSFKGFGGGGRIPGFGGRGGFLRNTRGNIPTSMYGRV